MLRTEHKEELRHFYEVGNDHSTGLRNKGKNEWGLFWACFYKFWFHDEKLISTWNIHCVERFDNYCDMHNCTSNGVEWKVDI